MHKILNDIMILLDENDIKDISSYELADMMWLGAIMDNNGAVNEKKKEIEAIKEQEDSTDKEESSDIDSNSSGESDSEDIKGNNSLEEDNGTDDLKDDKQEPSTTPNPLHLDNGGQESSSPSFSKGEYRKIPTPRHYTQYNQFATVLKILRQQGYSLTDEVLDEDATVEYIANTQIWNVVTKPKQELKFTLNIIIEKSESMMVWEEMTKDFVSAVSGFIFFKNLKVYYLEESEKKFQLYSDKKCQSKVSVNVFHSLEQRTLTMLMSDCISQLWSDNRGYKFLQNITQLTPFMILNMLPQRIWKRTILDDTWRIKFTHKKGWLNRNLVSDIDEKACEVDKNHIKVPMTTFDTISLKHWSNLVAGKKENWLYGSLFEAKWFDHPPQEIEESQEEENAVELVRGFEIFASPMAQKLAIYFSTVPLSLDIMKIVQKVSLPKSNHTHLAEVFLSGLLKKTPNRTKSKKVIYEFIDGVRDILKDKLYLHKKIDVLKENTSFIARELDSKINFMALMENPSLIEGIEVGENDRVFAEIIADVFGEMGGEYSNFSNRLVEYLKGVEEDIKVVIPNSKRFMMGIKDGRLPREADFEVIINYDFEISLNLVTFDEYDTYCKEMSITKPNDENWGRKQRPVINISWNDAVDYCKWISKKLGKKYRLPTEAEWKFSAIADKRTNWFFGDDEKLMDSYAWISRNSNKKTHPVAIKKSNPWGLYDIYGNVWEWTLDDNGYEDIREKANDGSANRCNFSNEKVFLGGGWSSTPTDTLDLYDIGHKQTFSYNDIGFRLVSLIDKKEKLINKIEINNFVQPKMIKILNSLSLDTVKIPNKNYEMGKYPITIAEYMHFAKDTDSHYPEWVEKGSKYNIKNGSNKYYKQMDLTDNAPIIGISWHDAIAYCDWLSQKSGNNYRLPTEKEWEYACRAKTMTNFSFGDDEKELNKYGWYIENSQSMTHEVGKKEPNPWGLYDIHGNVLEWIDNNIEKNVKMLRGGSWKEFADACSTSFNSINLYSTTKEAYVGFRVLLDLEKKLEVGNFIIGDDIKIDETQKSNDITFNCEKCSISYGIDCDELDWKAVESHNRDIGAETNYKALYEETCNECNNKISIVFKCREYPIGVENMRDITSSKVVNLEGDCCLEFNVSDEDFIKDWLFENYESSFQYLHGESYLLKDILYKKFKEKYSYKYINQVIEDLEENDDITYWLKKESNKKENIDSTLFENTSNDIDIDYLDENGLYVKKYQLDEDMSVCQVKDEFHGWKGDTIVKLTDNTTWQQIEDYKELFYSFMPEATIFEDENGFILYIDGTSKEIRVRKLSIE